MHITGCGRDVCQGSIRLEAVGGYVYQGYVEEADERILELVTGMSSH